MQRGLGVVAVCCLAFAGCIGRNWLAAPPPSPVASAPAPTKTAPATLDTNPLTFDVDEKSGKPKLHLVLSLDAKGKEGENGTALPACIAPLSADFELGVYACAESPESSHPLTAGNVEQACYTAPKSAKTAASKPLTLGGCRKGVLALNTFQPALRLDMEAQDLN